MKRRVFFLIGIGIAVAVVSFFLSGRVHAPVTDENLTTIILRGDDETIVELRVEIADDVEERIRGLMLRTSLPDGQGMLFIFDDETVRSFWMRNTLIPLDILYFDASGSFVYGTTMTPCEVANCPTYSSQRPAAYALEVPAGFLAARGEPRAWQLEVPAGVKIPRK